MNKEQKRDIPLRGQIPETDRWDLSSLYPNETAWEEDLQKLDAYISRAESFRGTLGSSPESLKSFLDFLNEAGLCYERLEHYAFLRASEDGGSDEHQARLGKISQKGSRLQASLSFFEPELLSIDESVMTSMLAHETLKPYSIKLQKILRFRPHVLSPSEERILALQSEPAETPQHVFEALTNVDLDFGTVAGRPLSQSTFASFLMDFDRSLRETAYRQFYLHFDQHKHTLASLYAGSIKQDTYQAFVRSHACSRAMALFPDNVSEEVYDNLVSAVRDRLPALHRYYRLRKHLLGLDELRHYDVYVPLIKDVNVTFPYDEAVELICDSLAPLGTDYVETLRGGLLGRWVDRYENKGKRSGAFSAGSFSSDPFILMNYKEDVLRDVFTLAHEGGHSMHSWYSSRSNPFQHYRYTIFEAEVASTFNEQLLASYLIARADSDAMKAYIISKQLDDIIATMFRQTMFAEFEHRMHASQEAGSPVTLSTIRTTYRELQEAYFGDAMVLEEVSDLEALRIPHFYRAFYVYKYATGLSAALALSRTVMEGGAAERDRYLAFLRSGGSKYPIDSLREAGVDMSTPEPVYAATDVFASLLGKLETLMGMSQGGHT